MTDITYTDLLDLIANGTLVPNDEYRITDYPTFQPVLKARTTNELWRDGYTSNGYKLLYNPVNNGEYDWLSSYGWVYYLEDANGNSAWCDWVNDAPSLFNNTTGVHITPYIISGQFEIPTCEVTSSSDIVVGGSSTVQIDGCRHVSVGDGNSGTLYQVDYFDAGDGNSGLAISKSTSLAIGSQNANLTAQGVSNIEVGNTNRSVTLNGGNNSIGSGNSTVNINGTDNEVNGNNSGLNITGSLNSVSDSKYVEINSTYNDVMKSEAVSLKSSVGNKIDSSKLVYLDNINNNDVWANEYVKSQNEYILPDGVTVKQYDTGDPEPFQKVTNINGDKVKKVVVNKIPVQTDQTDNIGLVINTVDQRTKNSTKTDRDYYISKDGIWNTEVVTTDEWDVVVIISKSDSLRAYDEGAGRYRTGSTCTLDYSWVDPNYTASFLDENNTEHSAPYTFIVTGNTFVTAKITHI